MTELERLDERIASLEAELAGLRSRRLELSPPPSSTPSAEPRSSASVVLVVAALVLVAAVASFAAFVWPALTPTLRVALLGAVTLGLASAAFSLRTRLPHAAEALAAVAAGAAAVLAVWWYVSSDSSPGVTGVGLALAASGAAVFAALFAHRFVAWSLASALLWASGSFAVALDAQHTALVAAVAALLAAAAARLAASRPFVWATAILTLTALGALATEAQRYPSAVPLGAGSLLLALAAARLGAQPRSTLLWHARAAFAATAAAALSPLMLLAPRALFVDSADARVDAAILALAAAASAGCSPQLRRLSTGVAPLAALLASANTPWVLLPAALFALAVLALGTPPLSSAAVVFSLAVALTAADLGPEDFAPWLTITLAAVLSAAAAVQLRWRPHPLAPPSASPRLARLVDAAPALTAAALAALAWLVAAPPGPLETMTLPAALLLAGGYLLAPASLRESSWPLAPAFALALLPSTVATAATGAGVLWRTVAVALTATLVIATGARHRLAGLVVPAAATLTTLALLRFFDLASALPLWAPLALAGVALLAVGARLEASIGQARRTTAWLSSLH